MASPLLNVKELPPEDATRMLKRTGIDLMIAGAPANWRVKFFAAHSRERSIAAVKMDGETFVWELTGADEAARRQRVQNVREQYGANQ